MRGRYSANIVLVNQIWLRFLHKEPRQVFLLMTAKIIYQSANVSVSKCNCCTYKHPQPIHLPILSSVLSIAPTYLPVFLSLYFIMSDIFYMVYLSIYCSYPFYLYCIWQTQVAKYILIHWDTFCGHQMAATHPPLQVRIILSVEMWQAHSLACFKCCSLLFWSLKDTRNILHICISSSSNEVCAHQPCRALFLLNGSFCCSPSMTRTARFMWRL